MKIIKREEAPHLETVKGRQGEILMSGENCMMMVNTIEPGIPTPPHSHPHEQIGYLIEGTGILYIDGEIREITAQVTFLVPPPCRPQLRCYRGQTRRPRRSLRSAQGGLPREGCLEGVIISETGFETPEAIGKMTMPQLNY
jgi:hypothetical protein